MSVYTTNNDIQAEIDSICKHMGRNWLESKSGPYTIRCLYIAYRRILPDAWWETIDMWISESEFELAKYAANYFGGAHLKQLEQPTNGMVHIFASSPNFCR